MLPSIIKMDPASVFNQICEIRCFLMTKSFPNVLDPQSHFTILSNIVRKNGISWTREIHKFDPICRSLNGKPDMDGMPEATSACERARRQRATPRRPA